MSQTDGRKGEFATHHLLSFVTNCEGNMVSIHMNLDGLTYLIEKLEGLKKLVEDGHCLSQRQMYCSSLQTSK